MGEAPSVTTPALASLLTSREPSASALGDLRATVRCFPRVSPHGPFTPPAAAVLCGSPVDSAVPSHGVPSVSFWRADRGSDVDRGIGGWAIVPLRMKIRRSCNPFGCRGRRRIRTQSWRPCLSRAAARSGLEACTPPSPSPRGEMIGSSARAVARDHALPGFLSSRKCTRSWWSGGRPLLFTARRRLVCSSNPLVYPRGRAATGVRRHFLSPGGRVRLAVHLVTLQNAATLEELSSSPVKAL